MRVYADTRRASSMIARTATPATGLNIHMKTVLTLRTTTPLRNHAIIYCINGDGDENEAFGENID